MQWTKVIAKKGGILITTTATAKNRRVSNPAILSKIKYGLVWFRVL